jgi:subtilisin family serine protease
MIVRGSAVEINKLRTDSKVNAVVAFKGSFKLSESVPTISVFSKDNVLPLLITAFTASDVLQLRAELAKMQNVQILEAQDLYLAIQANLSVANFLANHEGVEFVQTITPMTPFHMNLSADIQPGTKATGDYSDITGFETGTRVMNFDAAWAAGFHGENQVVSFADTGLDRGEIASLSADFTGAVAAGYKFGPGAKNWADPMGHGTHVAGSVAGRGVISGGKLKGGAYAAGLVPEGMWSPLIENLVVPAKMDQLFASAMSSGARIHTNSWGAPTNLGVYDSNAQKVDDYTWNNPDMLVLFAAGNSGIDADKDGKIDDGSVSSPGTAKNALTVGASENLVDNGGIQKKISDLRTAKDSWPAEPIWSSKLSDNIDGIAMFSSRGPTKDGRLKPEIVAPGTNILSTFSHEPGAEVLWGAYNADYVWSGGTSMATPLTAGAAAVARQYLVEKAKIANPSGAMVKALLMHTAKDMYPGQYGRGTPTQELQHRPDVHQGYGRVDLAAVTSASVVARAYVDERAGVAQGSSITYTVNVPEGKTVLVNLAYMDAPATPSSGKNLVNDLSLSIESNGQTLLAHNDHINNSRIVELKSAAAGTYTIRVKGENVPMGKSGKVPFALVYSVL